MKCKICGCGNEFQSVRADFVYGGKEIHKFYECSKCDAIYLNPTLSDEEEAFFYKKEFEKFMSSRAGSDYDWTNAQKHIDSNQENVSRRWRFMADYAKPGMKLLEIGCSTGFMLDHFKEEGLEVKGIELSDEFVPFLKDRGYEIFLSLEELIQESSQQKFDIITHYFVFEHIRDPFDFLEKSYQLLNKEGWIIMEVPSATDPLTSLYHIPAFEKFYWSIAHHYYYRPKTIEHILDKLGYTYKILPEQRYDLSNHIRWMTEGKPGGQGMLNHVFSEELCHEYMNDLKASWNCDTMFVYIQKT